MSSPRTKQELATYCLKALGAPVINIEVEGSQLDDRIDDALEFFNLYHHSGVTTSLIWITFSARDAINQTVTFPENVVSIVEIFENKGLSGGNSTEEFERANFLLAQSNLFNIGGFNRSSAAGGNDLLSYHMTLEYMATLRRYFNTSRNFSFNELTCQLTVLGAKVIEGNGMLVKAYVKTDPAAYEKLWSDLWLRKLCVAYVKKQWGANLKKYDNVQMVGGVTVNGQIIFDEAVAEIEKIEMEFIERNQLPIDFFWG